TTASPTRSPNPCCAAWRRRSSSASSRRTRKTHRPRHPPMAKSRRRCHSRPSNPLQYPPMKTLICDCNKTMPLDAAALAKALPPEAAQGLSALHSTLCRREAGSFQRAAKGGEDLLVACTQEGRLYLELNAETEGA